jgi:hypothetical protein
VGAAVDGNGSLQSGRQIPARRDSSAKRRTREDVGWALIEDHVAAGVKTRRDGIGIVPSCVRFASRCNLLRAGVTAHRVSR